jgi:osmoprotectant transport system permease protein
MTDFLQLIAERHEQLIDKTLQHLVLSGTACVTATFIGIPLGMLIKRWKKLSGAILGIAGVVQTVPSIAMLALLLVWFGSMGFLPAFVALVLYALLPIIRNTYTGLISVDPAILEAADGMGYTDSQRLWQIELPLATPVIIAGIRTATVITVGIATLSTFIGAGGLGDFINRGLSMRNTNLILLGVISASILALTLDCILGLIEKRLRKRLRQIV